MHRKTLLCLNVLSIAYGMVGNNEKYLKLSKEVYEKRK